MLQRAAAVSGARCPACGGGAAACLAYAVLVLLALAAIRTPRRAAAQVPAVPPNQVPPAKAPQTVTKPPATAAGTGVSRWFNPATAPFIPIPEVAADPDKGTTVGPIPGADGRVFWPAAELHEVIGVGFRGVARPFVVGYVDVGYGNQGATVFSGIGYPF